ncbi:hypothetical protein [Cecembia sp.]|uniref:hypothetical protein n=1 Tax=Cecembia sp. TaxID=1898110 RepID=UPI0025C3E4A9|nr:hypothetical protein [Cecembia sp.]
MRYSLIGIILFSFCLPSRGWGQQIEVTPSTGYTFGSGFDITGGRAKLEGNVNLGLFLGYTPKRFTELELSYNFLGTNATANSIYLTEDVVSRSQLHFVMFGVNRLIIINQQLTFFSGLKLGSATLGFPEGDFEDQSRFSVGVQVGMKYFITDRIGLRTQAHLLLPVISEGGSLWWNPNTGIGISGWSPILPFSLNAGMIVRLGM